MPLPFEQVNDPTPWISSLQSHDPKSVPKHFDFPESPEYLQDHTSRAGSPFESDSSDSDCSSDSGYDPPCEAAANPSSTILEPLFSSNTFLFDWDVESIGQSNALGLEFMSEGLDLGAQAVATSILQAESLQAPPYHQDARSCDRPNQKHQAQPAHSAPQPDGPATETLAGGCPQDIGLQDEVRDASGLNKFQGAHVDPESRKSYRGGDMGKWPNTGYIDQLEVAAAANGVSTYDWELLRTPRMRIIPLPEEGDDDDLLYNGSGLGGWLDGTFDGVPKAGTLGHLDFALPVPFPVGF